jgi:hypothetical protein
VEHKEDQNAKTLRKVYYFGVHLYRGCRVRFIVNAAARVDFGLIYNARADFRARNDLRDDLLSSSRPIVAGSNVTHLAHLFSVEEEGGYVFVFNPRKMPSAVVIFEAKYLPSA